MSSVFDKLFGIFNKPRTNQNVFHEVPLIVLEVIDSDGFNEKNYFELQKRVLLKEPDFFELRQPNSLTLFYDPAKNGSRRADDAMEAIESAKREMSSFATISMTRSFEAVNVVLNESRQIAEVVYRDRSKKVTI